MGNVGRKVISQCLKQYLTVYSAETPESIIAGLSASDSKPKGLTMEEKFLESPQEVKRPAKQKVTMPARLYEKGVKEDRKKRREEAKKKKNEFSFFDKKNKDLIMSIPHPFASSKP